MNIQKILFFIGIILLPCLVVAQSKSDLDLSLNYGQGSDFKFNTGSGANEEVYSICLLPDGKSLIGGRFSTYNGVQRNKVARLNADGSVVFLSTQKKAQTIMCVLLPTSPMVKF